MADTYTVERTITIAAAPAEVYGRIADFRRWTAWSPYEQLDPAMRRTYSGAETGSGAVYEWAGNMKAGTGRMEITDTEVGARIVIDQRFLKPVKSTSVTTFTLTETDGITTVSWATTGPKTTMTRMMGLIRSMDRLLGPMLEQGLAALKRDAEG